MEKKFKNLSIIISILMANSVYADTDPYLVDLMKEVEVKLENRLEEIREKVRNNEDIIISGDKKYLSINNINYEIYSNGNIKMPLRPISDESALRNAFPFFDDEWELSLGGSGSGALFVNKKFGNYNYGEGCLLEYWPNKGNKARDKYITNESISCKYNDEIVVNHQKKYDFTFYNLMNIPKQKAIIGLISDVEKLEKSQIVNLNDVGFIKSNGLWYVENKTFMPMKEILTSINDSNEIILIKLDQVLEPYSKAKLQLNFDERIISKLSFKQQLGTFNPEFRLGTNINDCDDFDKSKTCYSSPIGNEREVFERTYGHIRDAFNKVSFINEIEDFFLQNCNAYSDCKVYTENNPNAIPYAYRSYLAMGVDDHPFTPKVMRNIYYAEGAGNGSVIDLDHKSSNGWGWASIWASYVDINSSTYRISPIRTLFHEAAHGHGFDHSSGMTYGISEYLNDIYIPQQGNDIDKTPIVYAPDVIVQETFIAPNKLSLRLYSKNKHSDLSAINFRITSNKELSFSTKYPDTTNNNNVIIEFNETPLAAVYIKVWDQDSNYVTTLKYSAYDLGKKPEIKLYENYYHGGKELTLHSDVSDLSIYDFDNNLSSWKLPGDLKVVFYDDKNYQGERWIFYHSGDTNGFNDRVSSFKLLKRQENQVPEVSLQNNYQIKSGETLTITANASDLDGDDLKFTWDIPVEFTVIGENNKDSITLQAPLLKDHTIFNVTVRVNDGEFDAQAHSQIKVEKSVDPEGNQYPIWNSSSIYTSETISHDGLIYQSRWWNQNSEPSSNNETWKLISNIDLLWDKYTVYNNGDITTYMGDKWQAKWWNKGEIPGKSNAWEKLN
ncbi:carbohydrate-binding protein [Photobacterium aquimaris]|uniref:Chitinase A n=1 Tax=Photobacterium aquimaris TaxID=512643 RepID=A0A1Y6L1G5_9GAMM|nr:beta/gamma crystallin-related protein [Photobacterium aquimaris]SMY17466.1 Chitinase A precursor [Photobacterium aquimaris]